MHVISKENVIGYKRHLNHVCFYFVCVCAHKRFIKLSSPTLNNVAVIGCILVYATVVLMGLDDRIMPPDVFSVVCTVRLFSVLKSRVKMSSFLSVLLS